MTATLPTRTVTFVVDERWAGRTLRFRLTGWTYTDDVQVPLYEVAAPIGADGTGEVDLFPNELGGRDTEWEVQFPDRSRRTITVPDGVAALNLTTLLEAAS